MPAAPPEPRHPRRLAGSKWTSHDPALPYCHWIVIEVSRGEVELQAILAPAARVRLPWRGLRERPRWEPGWSLMPPDPGQDGAVGVPGSTSDGLRM